MKTRKCLAACIILLSLLFFLPRVVHAQPSPGDTNTFYYGTPIGAWSFSDTNYWTSDFGYAPVSFSNVGASWLGDGTAAVFNETNSWLQYNVIEEDGATNLTVDFGSMIVWFAPNWTGTNEGSTGPGVWGRLLEVGDSSGSGLWSLYVDPAGVNIYFTVQTNGGPAVTYLSAPIDWGTTNYWHSIALTYSTTNTLLYLDGWIATNGPAITNFPGPEVLANGFFIGSDSTGNNQAKGMFDDIYTYDYPISASTVSVEDLTGMMYLRMNPLNAANFSSAPSTYTTTPTFQAVVGPGFLQWKGTDANCVTGTNVFIKNVSAVQSNGVTSVTFTISGGVSGAWYDVFAIGALAPNGTWAWMGQGTNCGIYSLSLSNSMAFLILGTPLDSDGDGLTDAYEKLVSKTNPQNPDTDGDGMPDGWEVVWGTDPLSNDAAQTGQRSNFIYDQVGWLNTLSGTRSETIGLDPEGNVQTAH